MQKTGYLYTNTQNGRLRTAVFLTAQNEGSQTYRPYTFHCCNNGLGCQGGILDFPWDFPDGPESDTGNYNIHEEGNYYFHIPTLLLEEVQYPEV